MKSEKFNYLSLTHFFSKALFLGVGITRILKVSKESAIFAILLGSILGYFILKFLLKINYSKSTGIKKIFMFIILYIMFIIGIIELVNLISSIYLIDTDKFVVAIPLLLTILYLNSKEMNINLKISNILLFIADALIIISFFGLVSNIKPLNYLPLFNTPIKKILLSSVEFAIYTVTPNILYGGIKTNFKIKNKDILKRYIISNIILSIIILVTQGILGSELVSLFKYPEYVVLKTISLLDFFNNVENIFSSTWIILIFIYLSICSKQMYDITYKKFKNNKIYPIFLFISVFLIKEFLLDNQIFLIYFFNNLWIICLILIILYLIVNLSSIKNNK